MGKKTVLQKAISVIDQFDKEDLDALILDLDTLDMCLTQCEDADKETNPQQLEYYRLQTAYFLCFMAKTYSKSLSRIQQHYPGLERELTEILNEHPCRNTYRTEYTGEPSDQVSNETFSWDDDDEY